MRLELVLAYTDHAVAALGPAWPAREHDPGSGGFVCGVTADEVDAARSLAGLEPEVLADRCREPERARRALEWLTADLARMPLRYHPGAPLLGPALAVRAHGRHPVRNERPPPRLEQPGTTRGGMTPARPRATQRFRQPTPPDTGDCSGR